MSAREEAAEIVVGQVWERLSDGRRVQIVRYSELFGDFSCVYAHGRQGPTLHGSTLRKNYRLIEKPTP